MNQPLKLRRLGFVFLVLCLFTSLISLSLSSSLTQIKSSEKSHLSDQLQTGDLVFQSTTSGQGLAIQLATGSKYTHVGIILNEGGEMKVLEAVQPVRIIPFIRWIQQGDGNHYVAKRLKDDDLTPQQVAKMKLVGEGFVGKNYDPYFNWSDSEIYCSELVWKVYQRGAGIELAKTRPLKDYDLDHPIVLQKLKERYGKNIPLDEPMVAPSDLFQSTLLNTVNIQ